MLIVNAAFLCLATYEFASVNDPKEAIVESAYDLLNGNKSMSKGMWWNHGSTEHEVLFCIPKI